MPEAQILQFWVGTMGVRAAAGIWIGCLVLIAFNSNVHAKFADTQDEHRSRLRKLVTDCPAALEVIGNPSLADIGSKSPGFLIFLGRGAQLSTLPSDVSSWNPVIDFEPPAASEGVRIYFDSSVVGVKRDGSTTINSEFGGLRDFKKMLSDLVDGVSHQSNYVTMASPYTFVEMSRSPILFPNRSAMSFKISNYFNTTPTETDFNLERELTNLFATLGTGTRGDGKLITMDAHQLAILALAERAHHKKERPKPIIYMTFDSGIFSRLRDADEKRLREVGSDNVKVKIFRNVYTFRDKAHDVVELDIFRPVRSKLWIVDPLLGNWLHPPGTTRSAKNSE